MKLKYSKSLVSHALFIYEGRLQNVVRLCIMGLFALLTLVY